MAALLLSLLFASRAMAPAFGPGDVVHDDARQHVFWMARFHDPELFPGDLLAEYYQTVDPPAYRALFWALSWVVDPLSASKILALPLGLILSIFMFLFVRRLHPGSPAAFLATVLLGWYFWQHADLTSGTPREFFAPLLAVQLWSLASGRLALAAGVVVLAALFYPVAGVLGVVLLGLQLIRLRGGHLSLSRERPNWLALVVSASSVGAVLLAGQVAAARFGPTVSGAQARQLSDFGPNGRIPFFDPDPYRYWIKGDESGLGLSATDPLLKAPVLLEYAVLAGLLPLLLLLRHYLPSTRCLSRCCLLLVQLTIASVTLFVAAHLLLFLLYHPSRYVKWSLPIAFSAAAGLALGILLQEIGARAVPRHRELATGALALALGLGLLLHPTRYENDFRRDRHPTITAYLRAQPKDVLIAGVPLETDSLPTFALRGVLTNREHLNPFHLGFYGEMRQRTEDLIEAYYAESVLDVGAFATRYGVDIFLVDRTAFNRATYVEAWRGGPNGRWEPFTTAVARKLEGSRTFALLDFARRCAAIDDGVVAAVPISCIRQVS